MKPLWLLLMPLLLGVCTARRQPSADEKPRRSFELEPEEVSELVGHLRAKSLRLSFALSQEAKSHATLLALYSRRRRRTLEIQSSSKRDWLKVTFRTLRKRLTSITAPAALSASTQHRVTLLLSGDRLALALDCAVLFNESVPHMDLTELDGALAEPQAFVGRRETSHHFLHGSVGEVAMEPYSSKDPLPGCEREGGGRSARPAPPQPPANAMAPKESESSQPQSASLDYLKHRVGHLESEFRRWRDNIQGYESQLRHVQLHQRGCVDEEEARRRDGEEWRLEPCTQCVCHRGKVRCHREGCPALNCTGGLVHLPDQCCPTCGEGCWLDDEERYIPHGDKYSPSHADCIACECDDGRLKCRRNPDCPALDCPEEDQYPLSQATPPHSCCPVCKGKDWCASKPFPCSLNGTCANGPWGAQCRCKEGFHGDGQTCVDLDECQWTKDIREQLGGCGAGTRCINSPGSFSCECLPGFVRIDDRNCLDLVLI